MKEEYNIKNNDDINKNSISNNNKEKNLLNKLRTKINNVFYKKQNKFIEN
jgi:hypothetical protein